MSDEDNLPTPWERLQSARFEIGGRDELARIREKYLSDPGEAGQKAVGADWTDALRQLQVRIGTLLKTDIVSFLMGAGVSLDCGGVLLGSVPREVETRLLLKGVSGDPPAVEPWLLVFYNAVAAQGALDVPVSAEAILDRLPDTADIQPLKANYEQVLSQLYRWRNALGSSGCLSLESGGVKIATTAECLALSLKNSTQALADAVRLPVKEKADGLEMFKTFLRKVLTRPLNQKRVNLFTLNYDSLLEQAADASGIVLVDGFVGCLRRVFRPECYDQDLYFPAQTTEGRVHRYDRVLHLYKLHGSLSWLTEEPSLNNPYAYSGQSGHPFRLKLATDSGAKLPAVPGQTVQSPGP